MECLKRRHHHIIRIFEKHTIRRSFDSPPPPTSSGTSTYLPHANVGSCPEGGHSSSPRSFRARKAANHPPLALHPLCGSTGRQRGSAEQDPCCTFTSSTHHNVWTLQPPTVPVASESMRHDIPYVRLLSTLARGSITTGPVVLSSRVKNSSRITHQAYHVEETKRTLHQNSECSVIDALDRSIRLQHATGSG